MDETLNFQYEKVKINTEDECTFTIDQVLGNGGQIDLISENSSNKSSNFDFGKSKSIVSVNGAGKEQIKLSNINKSGQNIPRFEQNQQNQPTKEARKIETINGLDIYLYPSIPFNSQQEAQCRTIMVVGETGSGKTTLLNALVNFIMGVQFSDIFRYKLVNEITGRDMALFQTNEVNIYYIAGKGNYPPIRIIDTPGFGDTRGLNQDLVTMQKIRDCLTNNVDVLDSVCFVVQASNNKLTVSQKYIFGSILEMYGKDLGDNLVCMLTFCDGSKPRVLESLTFKGDPNNKDVLGNIVPIPPSFFVNIIDMESDNWYFRFNNSALFEDNRDKYNTFTEQFWHLNFNSFEKFFNQKLIKLKCKSLNLTRDVLNEKERLRDTIYLLQNELKQGLMQMNNTDDLRTKISQFAFEVESNKYFKVKRKDFKIQRVDVGEGIYVTNCVICNRTCHDHCAYSNDEDKINCIAITNEHCTICSKKCFWQDHKNMPFKFVTYEVEIEVEVNDLKLKYTSASSKKSQYEQILAGINKELYDTTRRCMLIQQRIKDSINRLHQIALKPACFRTNAEYIDLMVISEQQEQGQGFIQRIQALNDMKECWELVGEAYTNDGRFKDMKEFIEQYDLNKVGEKLQEFQPKEPQESQEEQKNNNNNNSNQKDNKKSKRKCILF